MLFSVAPVSYLQRPIRRLRQHLVIAATAPLNSSVHHPPS